MDHVYSENEAQRILDEFPANSLEQLVTLAWHCRAQDGYIRHHAPIVLPDGWNYEVFDNCIVANYKGGEQERKMFYVPIIWIDYKYVPEVTTKKSVEKILPLGYCTCGKPMWLIQGLLWASDMIEKKGSWAWPSNMVGHAACFFLGKYLSFNPIWSYSIQFNRHPDCL